MKSSKFILIVSVVLGLSMISTNLLAQDQAYEYAYIAVKGKVFSKKLRVDVDFGDTQEQMETGEKYSQLLTNKTSYAAILNYMVENNFELVETLDYVFTNEGTGGTFGIVFIMRQKK